MKLTFLRFAPVVLLLAAGCQMSRVNTSTGLPYWPPGDPRGLAEQQPAAMRPAPTAGQAAPAAPQASEWRAAATRWVGVPYRLGGQDRSGLDCSAFSGILHREVAGRTLARTTQAQWTQGRPIEVQNAQPGDLVFFQTIANGGQVSHVGVSMGGKEFAHASTSRGVMFSSLAEPYWDQRFVGARRMAP